MKFRSENEYIKSFKTKINTVGGRQKAELEIIEDTKQIIILLQKSEALLDEHNKNINQLNSNISKLKQDKNSYTFNFFIKIMKSSVSEQIKAIDAELAILHAETISLFGCKHNLNNSREFLGKLHYATRIVLKQIHDKQKSHKNILEYSKNKRAAIKREKEAKLAPYVKRIELGAAAMGKTRSIASARKSKLKKSEDCPYCGKPLGSDSVADHIYPVARGGLSVIDNMVFICTPCNQKKSDRTLNEYIYKFQLDMEAIHKRLSNLGKRF